MSVSSRLVRPALTAALVLSSLSSLACSRKHDSSGSPTSPTPPPASSTPVSYTAVGASDAIGIGATQICITLAPCPTGTGYVPVIARQLGASGRSVTLNNLGIPGAVLSRSTQDLARRYGREIVANFIDQELPLVPPSTTLVTIFAGGNDVNAIGAAIDRGAAGADPNAFIDQQIRQFATDMDVLLRGIRNVAPASRIVVANLPNLARLPYQSGTSAPQREIIRRLAVGFSTQALNPLASQGVVIADLACDSRAYDPGNFSPDGFHPNDRGYQFMADALLVAINATSPAPPRGPCAEMESLTRER